MTFLTGAARRGAPPKRAYLAIALLVAAFLLGGGSRADIVSLLLLRPLSAVALVYALWKYGPLFWQERWLPGLIIAIVLLPVLHLVPLPPAIWSELPGRGVVADTFRATGMALPWQAISMTPIATLNALLSLMLPVAMLLLCFSLDKAQQAGLLRAVLIIGMASGLLGLLQAIGSPTSPLYLYRITNNGMAVGLFANRNHQAIFLACLLPLLAAHLSLISARQETVIFQKTVTIAAAVFLIPRRRSGFTARRSRSDAASKCRASGSFRFPPISRSGPRWWHCSCSQVCGRLHLIACLPKMCRAICVGQRFPP